MSTPDWLKRLRRSLKTTGQTVFRPRFERTPSEYKSRGMAQNVSEYDDTLLTSRNFRRPHTCKKLHLQPPLCETVRNDLARTACAGVTGHRQQLDSLAGFLRLENGLGSLTRVHVVLMTKGV
jgi:hypothetical protein